MLGALENHYTTDGVRRIVARRLSEAPLHLEMHSAILRLARLRQREGLRLVTTNYDNYFDQAGEGLGLEYSRHSGPVLPIPRNDNAGTWRSLVYLHGRLGDGGTQPLVLTSADFGRAYLTDGWAARFVARLFAEFSVLFIGYSLNDPVMRYMIDAIAAEDAEARYSRPRGPAYIFIPYEGEADPPSQPFRDRNLEPIFYSAVNDHILLKETLLAWADARSDYLANTTVLINAIAPNRPDAISPADTANLLWAVAGRARDNGHGARVFASIHPPPPIEWFDELERRETELQTSTSEPAGPEPRPVTSQLFPDARDARNIPLSPLGEGLVGWLVQHLCTAGLADRVLSKLRLGSQTAFLSAYVHSAAAVRRRCSAGLLFAFLAHSRCRRRVDAARRRPGFGPALVVRESLQAGADLPAWLKQELVAALGPVLTLSPSPHLGRLETSGDRLSHLAHGEVDLSDGDEAAQVVRQISGRDAAGAFWAEFIDELTLFLRQALELYAVVDQASAAEDPSSVQRPSIVPHRQNFAHRRWTVLFDLIWLAWTHIDSTDSERSRAQVQHWRRVPFLAFRRLMLAAMNHSTHFSAHEQMEALLDG